MLALLALKTVCLLMSAKLAGGFNICLKTLFELNGSKPLIAKPALMFFGINAIFLIRLKRIVKCCLPIVFISPCLSQLV